MEDGQQVIRLVRYTADYPCPPFIPGFTSKTNREMVAKAIWQDPSIILQIEMEGETFTIRYGSDAEHLETLCVADGALINPEKVGCMSGTMIGMFATGGGTDSDNTASFDWFELI